MKTHTKEEINGSKKEYEYTCFMCEKKWIEKNNYDVTICPYCKTKGKAYKND